MTRDLQAFSRALATSPMSLSYRQTYRKCGLQLNYARMSHVKPNAKEATFLKLFVTIRALSCNINVHPIRRGLTRLTCPQLESTPFTTTKYF